MSAARPFHFSPGRGIGLVTYPFLVLIDAENARFAERLWALMDEGGGVDDLLEELSAAGLRNLGDFVMADLDDEGDVRIVVRGSATAVVTHAAESGTESRHIGAGDTRTWLETTVAGASAVRLGLDGESSGSLVYRATEGVLPAVALDWAAEREQPLELGELEINGPDVIEERELGDPAPRVRVSDPEPVDASTPEPDGEAETVPVELDDRTVVVSSLRPPADPAMTQVPTPKPQPDVIAAEPPSSGIISGIPGAAPAAAGDHDGHTISRSQMQAMRREGAPAAPAPPPAVADPSGPPVLGIVCASGHANAPHATACRLCGATLSADPVTVGRPALGALSFSSGERVVLTSPAIIGRNPKAGEGHYSEPPQFVRLDSGSALSRSHAAVRIEGWQVLVDDLGSQNGTTVTLPGLPPRRLHPGEPVVLEDGATIDLGGEVSATYDARGR